MKAELAAAARRAKRLGVLGGSFDPVHRGHLHVCRAALDARELDHVVFVPAARPPHKLGRELAPAADRLEMLERALAGEPRASIWAFELLRSGPSYTVETLRELVRLRGPGAPKPHLLLGTDNLEGLPAWREVDEVFALAHPLVIVRPGFDPDDLGRLERKLAPALVAELRAALVEVEPDPASSTEERAALRAGIAPEALAPAVRRYAEERGLYRDAVSGD